MTDENNPEEHKEFVRSEEANEPPRDEESGSSSGPREVGKRSQVSDSDPRLQAFEQRYADVQVSQELTQTQHGFGSPAGDAALPVLDKIFSQLTEYLSLKLKDGIAKTLILQQIHYVYMFLRSAVEHALT